MQESFGKSKGSTNLINVSVLEVVQILIIK